MLVKNLFASNIKRLRQAENLTQAQLAERLGLTQRKISYLEVAKVEPDIDTLLRLAKFFDITVDSLLTVEY